jgi:hypothetical protein
LFRISSQNSCFGEHLKKVIVNHTASIFAQESLIDLEEQVRDEL